MSQTETAIIIIVNVLILTIGTGVLSMVLTTHTSAKTSLKADTMSGGDAQMVLNFNIRSETSKSRQTLPFKMPMV